MRFHTGWTHLRYRHCKATVHFIREAKALSYHDLLDSFIRLPVGLPVVRFVEFGAAPTRGTPVLGSAVDRAWPCAATDSLYDHHGGIFLGTCDGIQAFQARLASRGAHFSFLARGMANRRSISTLQNADSLEFGRNAGNDRTNSRALPDESKTEGELHLPSNSFR